MMELEEGSGLSAYALHHALKLHFTTKTYDFVKYHGATNITPETFEHHKNKFTYYKIARKYSLKDMKDLFVSNLVLGHGKWITEMLDPTADKNYREWKKVNQSLTYVFENDILQLFDVHCTNNLIEMGKMIRVPDSGYPKLLLYTMDHSIHLETLIIMNNLMKFMEVWDKKITDDIVYPAFAMNCEKYKPFVNYNPLMCDKILREILLETCQSPI